MTGAQYFFGESGEYESATKRKSRQIFSQELLHGAIEVKTVFLVGETVPFVFLDHILHLHSSFSQSLHHLVTFRFRHAWVVRSLRDEKRNFDLVGMKCR